MVINNLLPENEKAWEMYSLVGSQINENGSLQIGAIEFIFNMYLPKHSTDEKKEIFEKMLLIHSIAMGKA